MGMERLQEDSQRKSRDSVIPIFVDWISQQSNYTLYERNSRPFLLTQNNAVKPRLPTKMHCQEFGATIQSFKKNTVCSSISNSCPFNTNTTNVLSGGISSTIEPSNKNPTFHYHTVVCNSDTCIVYRLITTPY